MVLSLLTSILFVFDNICIQNHWKKKQKKIFFSLELCHCKSHWIRRMIQRSEVESIKWVEKFSRVLWYMRQKPERWRKRICKVWRERNGWWWDGCAECRGRIGNSVNLYSLLCVQSVDEVVRRGRLRWFGHVERKSGDDWVSACRNVVVAGVRCAGRGRKTWYECVKDDMKALSLHPEWAVFRDMWRGFISGGTSNPSWAWKDGRFENKWWWYWKLRKTNFEIQGNVKEFFLNLWHFPVVGPGLWSKN